MYGHQNENKKALEAIERALKIFQEGAKKEPKRYLHYLAAAFNNLANIYESENLYEKALENYEKSLEIRRNLATENPFRYLRDVAETLNNVGLVHGKLGEFSIALSEYEEARDIIEALYKQTPKVYAPQLAVTLINLAHLFQKTSPERKTSLNYVERALELILPIIETAPYVQRFVQEIIGILQMWDFSVQEIEQLISEKMKGNAQD